MKTMMLWTLMLGMVQKVLQTGEKSTQQQQEEVTGGRHLQGVMNPKWSRETH